ncbi:MAG: hypothetical protein M1821_010038 [Bathelium mastoideum]|nr:MAG: hypothetical protein M1821_010038 [Bathelium mastoideum]
MVKFYFLKGAMPTTELQVQKITTLAYQTAREHKLLPKEILIRGQAHSTTTIASGFGPDPLGNHFTFCYKDEGQKQRGTHIACHGYTPSSTDYSLTQATFAAEKADATIKKHNGKHVWPKPAELDAGPEIGYHHE